MTRIGYLALAQAHQHLHWIAGALALAKRPGVTVDVLSASRANLDFIRRFDPDGLLHYRHLWYPHRGDGLFDVPNRGRVAALWHWRLMEYDALVTTETTSSALKSIPWFRVPMIHLKHGAGNASAGYNHKHRAFDFTLVNGEKDRQRLIDKGLATPETVAVVGYGKFELVTPASEPLFSNARPIALYNAHAKPDESSWFDHAPELVREMERVTDWNFVVAPHVKLAGGPAVASSATNILIDRGSERSIDMTYADAASVYIGDVSSQVFEFIRQPRPCIFLNLDRVDWRSKEAYQHWHFGQVIEEVGELGPALARAAAMQAQFEPLQREALAHSIDLTPRPSSERQADAVLEFLADR